MAVAYRGSASGRTYFLEKKLAKARESLYIRRTSLQVGRFPSGQRGQTVNLLAFAFEGSNPSLPTTLLLSYLLVALDSSRVFSFLACMNYQKYA